MNKTIPIISIVSIVGVIFAYTQDGIDYRGVLHENGCVDVYAKSNIPKIAKVEITLFYTLKGYSGVHKYGPITNETTIDSRDKIVLTACTKGEYQGHSFKVSKK